MTDQPGRLFEHIRHPHVPRNVNAVHQAEQQGINARIAVFLTRTVGSMTTAYVFVALALVGLLAILGVFYPLVALLVAWMSQTLIQLVLLPVIMVGQNVLNRRQELQTEEAFQTEQHSFHDIEQIMLHLDAQDAQLLKQIQMLSEMLDELRKGKESGNG
jgi:uncharacterized membrane protein